MIYISAQPDLTYFIWQLEIQLRSFHSLNINKDSIHVLVAYNSEAGLSSEFKNFIQSHSHLAQFFVYEDLRKNPKYTSTIRPNILKQHFEKFPDLENERVFYHDSDLLFSRIPEIPKDEKDLICYVSDTRSYISSDYIRRVGSDQLLKQMAAIVGLEPEIIDENNQHSGGAQYVLKGIDANFWQKVEKDSEDLFLIMKDFNQKKWENEVAIDRTYKSAKNGIQAWCADMWAVLWNLWYINKKVEIHSELDFSWPFSPIAEWKQKAILHYSGNIRDNKTYFKKTDYINFEPWYDESIHSIPKSNCSYKIVEQIELCKILRNSKRSSFRETCIIYDCRSWDLNNLGLFKIIKKYLQKYIDIDVIHSEDITNKVFFEKSKKKLMDYKKILLFKKPVIIDIRVMYNILNGDFIQNTTFTSEIIYKVDSLFTETFSKVLDIELLHSNKKKFNENTKESLQCNFHYFINYDCFKENYEQNRQLMLNDNFLFENTVEIPFLYSLN